MSWYPSMEAKRAAAWAMGVQHREWLVRQYMIRHGLSERPLLRPIVDDLIEEVQGARLVTEVLRLDTYGRTEKVQGRICVTINSRIRDMAGVKDVAGVVYMTKWHESVHIANDMDEVCPSRDEQAKFPGFDVEVPRIVVCRKTEALSGAEAEREFFAENAARAAAIAGPDLARCPAFQEFQSRAAQGGELPRWCWPLLYQVAAFLGVNITALVTHFEQLGLMHTAMASDGKQQLIAVPRLESTAWLQIA